MGVLGQVVFVPAATVRDQRSVEEDGIPAEWDRAEACVVVQSALEPEKVFEDVESRGPAGVNVHQLHSGLDDLHPLVQHDRIYAIEDLAMVVVFGFEYNDA